MNIKLNIMQWKVFSKMVSKVIAENLVTLLWFRNQTKTKVFATDVNVNSSEHTILKVT